jgi:molecular chaperone GrpE
MTKEKKFIKEETLTDTDVDAKDPCQAGQPVPEAEIAEGEDTRGYSAEEVEVLKKQIEEKDSALKEYIELSQRLRAEFENYKKRALKERELLYNDISGEIITQFLPVMDNMERAVSSAHDCSDSKDLLSGMEMILKQLKDILAKQEVEEISALDCEFDPQYHNAVMHVEDGSYEQNRVVEVFEKGYKMKDKILRYSMVKVAN